MRKTQSASMIAIMLAGVPAAIMASPPPPPSADMVSFQQPTSCQAEAAADSDIVVLSTSGQTGPIVPYAVDPEGVSHLIPVSGAAGRPVTLVLTSQSSAVWDLRGVSAGRIRTVYVSGTGSQGVIGAPKDAKVEIIDGRRGSQYGSGYSSSGCRPVPQVTSVNEAIPLAMSIMGRFGRYPDRLYAGRGASAFDLDKAEAQVPKSADVRIGDIRTSQPLPADTPPPGPLMLKKMLDDGSARIMTPDVISQINSAGMTIEPIGPAAVDPQEIAERTMINRPGVPEDVRRRMMESFRMRAEARAARMEQMRSYVPNYGIVLLKPVSSLPRMPGNEYTSAIFVPSDVTPPTGTTTRMFRLPMKASEVPQSMRSGSDNPLSRMLEQQPGTVPDIVATWKGDSMTVRMPQVDENGVRRPATDRSTAQAEEGSDHSMLVLAVIAVLALLGAAAYALHRRKVSTAKNEDGAATTGTVGAKASRVDALEVMVQDPGLKAAVRGFKEAAMKLIARQDLEPDLTARSNDILQKQFSAQASRYLAARPSSDEATGLELDRRLKASLETMTNQLNEIGDTQNKRHIDALG